MNLHALKIFHIVARSQSVTRASEMLRISQPAVTMQIRNLEKELGLFLLAPKGRGIWLTEAGTFLAAHAERLFALEQELETLVDDYRTGRSGSLRIAATYLPANFLLPGWIAAYKRKFAEVRLTQYTGNAQQSLERLERYEADVAVIGGGIAASPRLTRSVLFEDPMWFVVPPDHSHAGQEVGLADVLKETFIMREEGSSTREMLLALCRMSSLATPDIGVELGGMNEAVRAVAAGYGVLFASAAEVREFVERGEVVRVRVKHPEVKNPIAVYWREGEPLSGQAAAFVELITGRV
ncbi:LysR family transcriptional regulator [Paenibacillus tyrfis]|uniref:LysR family transcriptional regulator n=1 Tax=Paenibacillus tyrfis TaxID=1501230 RepID=UPI002493CEAB|nr:LysR family transcriptional regulator [Paenibacillus tyrfis]GLI08133.1 LysR family transcriptional regulator [Paenibacillus tyrfis]